MPTTHDLFEFASVALVYRDRDSLLKAFVSRLTAICAARAALVWLRDTSSKQLTCIVKRSERGSGGDLDLSRHGSAGEFLEECCDSREVRLVDSRDALASRLLHLESSLRSQLTSALYAPIRTVENSLGVLELLRANGVPFTDEDALLLEDAGRLLGQGLRNVQELTDERQSQLLTVERLTTLYDLGRTFTSSLELSELLPVVGSKICSVMEAAACNLWLADSRAQRFFLAQKTGNDRTVEEGATCSLSEGVFSEVVHTATPRLLKDPKAEPSLAARFQASSDLTVRSWMCCPLRKEQEVLGIVEVLNKQDGGLFTEDDLFFLANISEQAAVSLYNAKLLESERKVSALNALLKISQDITSTIDLKQILSTVVNQAGTLFAFDRCVIGYYDRETFILGAISGDEEVSRNEETKELSSVLERLSKQTEPASLDLYEDGWHASSESARETCVPFLEAHRYLGFYGIPLRDDQGPLGAMALLSLNAEFLSPVDREIFTILGNQTTVAIRNSQLYEQSPLRTLLGPWKLQSATKQHRWLEYAKRIAAVASLLVVVPWPLRISTNATIVPAHRRVLSSIEGGVIERVAIKEGDVVKPGDLLAQLNDGEDRIKLAQAQAALETARRELGEAEFKNDPSAAGQAKIRLDLHMAEVQLEQKRLNEARILSPFAGIVVTPKVEEKVGTMLKAGESFAEIVEQDRLAAELSVPESDLSLVSPGSSVVLKLNAFPTLTFRGLIERVGAESRSESNEQYFLVRAGFPNPGRVVKDGMVGRARVRSGGGWLQSGWYPVGYVLLRSPLRWLWMKLWTLSP